MVDLKEKIRFYRDGKKMNNNQLAIASGLNPSVISSLFTRSQEPEVSTLDAICKGLDITMSELFAENGTFDLTEEQQEILFLFNQLKSEKQELAIAVLKAFI